MSTSIDTGNRLLAGIQTAIKHNGQTYVRRDGHMIGATGLILISEQILSALLDDGFVEIDVRDRYEEGDGAEIAVTVTADGRKHLAVQLCIAAMSEADPDGDDFDDIFESVAAYFDPENWS